MTRAIEPLRWKPCAKARVLNHRKPGQSTSPKPGSTSSGSTPSSRANSSTTTSKTSSPSSSSLSARAASGRPVHHDPRWPGHAHRPCPASRDPAGPATRSPARGPAGPAAAFLLDRELHPGQLGLPAGLQPRDRLQDELIDPLRPAPVQRHPGRGQPAAQPAPMPVAPPDPDVVFRGLVPVPLTRPAQLPRVSRGARAPPGGRAARALRACRAPADWFAERDTIVQCAPGGGVTALGWVRSAVVSDARGPSPLRSRRNATNRRGPAGGPSW